MHVTTRECAIHVQIKFGLADIVLILASCQLRGPLRTNDGIHHAGFGRHFELVLVALFADARAQRMFSV